MSWRHMQRPSRDVSFRNYVANLQDDQASLNASRGGSRQQHVADQNSTSGGEAPQAHEESESEGSIEHDECRRKYLALGEQILGIAASGCKSHIQHGGTSSCDQQCC